MIHKELLLLAGLLAASLPVRAQEGPASPAERGDSAARAGRALADRVADLEARLQGADARRSKDSLAAALGSRPTITVTAGKEGFALRSLDGTFQIRLRGYFQSDGRFPLSERDGRTGGTFILRRVRPVWEVTAWRNVDFRLMPDFGEGRTTLFDAHLDLRLHSAAIIRAGKFKPPIGLERLQSATDLIFIERAHPTNLAPNRDVGMQLYGEVGGASSYALGIFNGVPDLGNGDADSGNHKDLEGRLFVQPFRWLRLESLGDLGVGIAGSRGVHRGSIGAPSLPTYRAPSQLAMFVYEGDGTAAGTSVADGRATRFAPQGYFYRGPVGLLGEWITSTQRVRRGPTSANLSNHAWNLTGSVALTGEHPSYRGLTPSSTFDPDKRTWGAFELGVRFSGLVVDEDSYPIFASAATQIREARTMGLALNWYLARGIRVMVDYAHTRFAGGAAGSGDREPEKVILTRMQHAF